MSPGIEPGAPVSVGEHSTPTPAPLPIYLGTTIAFFSKNEMNVSSSNLPFNSNPRVKYHSYARNVVVRRHLEISRSGFCMVEMSITIQIV